MHSQRRNILSLDKDKGPHKLTRLSIVNTNARSLRPKLESLLDCMNETDAHIAIVTESWLKDGAELDGLVQDLELGEGVGILCRNRKPGMNGVAYGGVALLWKIGQVSFRRVALANQEDFEVLAAVGTVPGQRRKLIVIACYLPCLLYTSDAADE